MNKKIITSWDDGHPLDLKVADVLSKYNIGGIFYIPIFNSQREVMNKRDLRELSSRFEIGGHTLNHTNLTLVDDKTAFREISEGKKQLEDIIGKKVTKFSYPWGKFNNSIIDLVKKAGYKEARIARIFNLNNDTNLENNKYTVSPNFHIYPHKILTLIAHCIKNRDIKSLSRLPLIYREDKLEMLEKSSNYFNNSTMHVWGHSWELYDTGMIKVFERFLKNYHENK